MLGEVTSFPFVCALPGDWVDTVLENSNGGPGGDFVNKETVLFGVEFWDSDRTFPTADDVSDRCVLCTRKSVLFESKVDAAVGTICTLEDDSILPVLTAKMNSIHACICQYYSAGFFDKYVASIQYIHLLNIDTY